MEKLLDAIDRFKQCLLECGHITQVRHKLPVHENYVEFHAIMENNIWVGIKIPVTEIAKYSPLEMSLTVSFMVQEGLRHVEV